MSLGGLYITFIKWYAKLPPTRFPPPESGSERRFSYCRKWLFVSQAIGDSRREAETRTYFADGLYTVGRLSECLSECERALVIWRRLADENIDVSVQLARAVRQLADSYKHALQTDKAVTLYEEAMALAEPLPDKRELAACLNNFGNLELCRGNTLVAEQLFARAYAILKDAQTADYKKASDLPYSASLSSSLGSIQRNLQKARSANGT